MEKHFNKMNIWKLKSKNFIVKQNSNSQRIIIT